MSGTEGTAKKHVFYNEWAYVLGIVILALGTVFMERADFGMSMVVAPAYLIYLKVSQVLPWFTFGMAEYSLQALLLIIMMLSVRRFRFSYLFSFITAIVYGCVLDVQMWAMSFIPCDTTAVRVIFFLLGMLVCSLGVSLLFHTYISPEAYELFVKEISEKRNINIHVFKTVYDCCSCAIGVILSFVFFGLWHFEGVKLGTLLCAAVNGFLISRCTRFYEKHWEFRDGMKWRKYFDK